MVADGVAKEINRARLRDHETKQFLVCAFAHVTNANFLQFSGDVDAHFQLGARTFEAADLGDVVVSSVEVEPARAEEDLIHVVLIRVPFIVFQGFQRLHFGVKKPERRWSWSWFGSRRRRHPLDEAVESLCETVHARLDGAETVDGVWVRAVVAGFAHVRAVFCRLHKIFQIRISEMSFRSTQRIFTHHLVMWFCNDTVHCKFTLLYHHRSFAYSNPGTQRQALLEFCPRAVVLVVRLDDLQRVFEVVVGRHEHERR
jgi:hypothetical protein